MRGVGREETIVTMDVIVVVLVVPIILMTLVIVTIIHVALTYTGTIKIIIVEKGASDEEDYREE